MTEHSDIPAPTPADDVIEHQERVEFVIDKEIAEYAATLVPQKWAHVELAVSDSDHMAYNAEVQVPIPAIVPANSEWMHSDTFNTNVAPGGVVCAAASINWPTGAASTDKIAMVEILIDSFDGSKRAFAYTDVLHPATTSVTKAKYHGGNFHAQVGTDLVMQTDGSVVSTAGGLFHVKLIAVTS